MFESSSLESPRFYTYPCQPSKEHSFSPLAQLLPEHTAPELLYLETKWASLMPYGVTVERLKQMLPIGNQLNSTTTHPNVHRVADRVESELGEEKALFLSDQYWEAGNDVAPAEPLAVGPDGGYVYGRDKQGHREGCFEVIL